MQVVALRDFISTQYGNISKGETIDVKDHHAQEWVGSKLAVYAGGTLEKKSVAPVVKKTEDSQEKIEETKSGLSSHPDQAAKKRISKKSKSGGKRKKTKGE